MSYVKEFVFPAIPIIFELILRWSFLVAPNWIYYINPGTIFISLGIWAALTSLRVPRAGRIKTDLDYNSSISNVKQLLLIIGIFGFMLFGALSFGDAILSRYQFIALEVGDQKQWFFVISAFCYAAITFLYVGANRLKIESLYGA